MIMDVKATGRANRVWLNLIISRAMRIRPPAFFHTECSPLIGALYSRRSPAYMLKWDDGQSTSTV